MRNITGIIVHCSATRPDWWHGKRTSEKVAEIRRWHKARGWSDIGYHYVIDRDGTVAKGRDLSRTGAHVKGRNIGTIGICLLGGHGSAETDQFTDHFTPEQDAALRRLIDNLQGRFWKVPVTGHNEYAAKACPGFTVSKWLPERPSFTDYSSKPAAKPTGGFFAALSAFFASIFGEKKMKPFWKSKTIWFNTATGLVAMAGVGLQYVEQLPLTADHKAIAGLILTLVSTAGNLYLRTLTKVPIK